MILERENAQTPDSEMKNILEEEDEEDLKVILVECYKFSKLILNNWVSAFL